MVYESNFEDELEFDEVPVSEETIEFDGLQKATAKAERRRKRRRLRNERTGKIAGSGSSSGEGGDERSGKWRRAVSTSGKLP